MLEGGVEMLVNAGEAECLGACIAAICLFYSDNSLADMAGLHYNICKCELINYV